MDQYLSAFLSSTHSAVGLTAQMNIRCEDIAAACIFEGLVMDRVLSLVSVCSLWFGDFLVCWYKPA